MIWKDVVIILLMVVVTGVCVGVISYSTKIKRLEKNLQLVMLTLSLASPAVARRLEEQGTQVVFNGDHLWDDGFVPSEDAYE